MAVYTEVSAADARGLLQTLALGELQDLRGIQGGIENTNYFVTTTRGEYVLTLFERLTDAQLPFYLHLMQHLARRNIPAPEPVAGPDGRLLHALCGKPACVVNRLDGASDLAPTAAHCEAVGELLAHMHLAARDFSMRQPNLRGLEWWNRTVPVVLPFLQPAQAQLLRDELAWQNQIAATDEHADLPRGPVHADLFRDNVLFTNGRLTGVFDFYFAGVDSWLFDLAVCMNDWAVDLPTGLPDHERAERLLAAYQSVRPLEACESRLLGSMLRAAALRFWVSRLWDLHLPREAAMLVPHDPAHFERVLRARVATAPDGRLSARA
ncbi:MAG: homoserine kinase [Burkholderiaceae bacterium]